jgi:endonuclease III
MTQRAENIDEILRELEKLYGPQRLAGPTDPYEMILFLNSAYPATDTKCAKGFETLKREVGVSPDKILASPKARLAKLLRPFGMLPEERVERLKDIARRVKKEAAGDLKAALKKNIPRKLDPAGKGLRAAKKLLQEFPVIGEPSADKILLFARLAPVAAVPSAMLHVPMRIWFGGEGKNYAADYRQAREVLSNALPEEFEPRQRAYLLLKKHGQEICKRSKPKCETCPLTSHCAYLQARAGDQFTEGVRSGGPGPS